MPVDRVERVVQYVLAIFLPDPDLHLLHHAWGDVGRVSTVDVVQLFGNGSFQVVDRLLRPSGLIRTLCSVLVGVSLVPMRT